MHVSPMLTGSSSTELLVAIITTAVATLTLWFTAVQAWAAVYPIWRAGQKMRALSQLAKSGVFDQATIESSTRYYVDPKCTNIDPSEELELRHALVATRESLFDKIDDFLDSSDQHRHLLLLADSGTGKTSCLLNYFAANQRRTKRRHEIYLVALGSTTADEDISAAARNPAAVLFLDALDEDTKAIAGYRERLAELMELCARARKVVVTCRTQFFPRADEIPVETGIARIGPVPAGSSKTYEFWKLYLSPFDDDDIDAYLRKRFPFWRRRARKAALTMVAKVPFLSVRPMLLAHIPDLLAANDQVRRACDLYRLMIDAWLRREGAWIQEKTLLRFSKLLAVELYSGRERRGMEKVSLPELGDLAQQWGIDVPKWQLSARSLLNRDAAGNSKFSHRSIMEYLVVRSMLDDEPKDEFMLTDQMKSFLVEELAEPTASFAPVSDAIQSVRVRYGAQSGTDMPSLGDIGSLELEAMHLLQRLFDAEELSKNRLELTLGRSRGADRNVEVSWEGNDLPRPVSAIEEAKTQGLFTVPISDVGGEHLIFRLLDTMTAYNSFEVFYVRDQLIRANVPCDEGKLPILHSALSKFYYQAKYPRGHERGGSADLDGSLFPAFRKARELCEFGALAKVRDRTSNEHVRAGLLIAQFVSDTFSFTFDYEGACFILTPRGWPRTTTCSSTPDEA